MTDGGTGERVIEGNNRVMESPNKTLSSLRTRISSLYTRLVLLCLVKRTKNMPYDMQWSSYDGITVCNFGTS